MGRPDPKNADAVKKYGFPTAAAMIVGIVIGSGIFFKSDNILVATGGSVFLGCLTLLIGAVSIVFGGVCVGELAALTDRPGGVVAYAEEFISPRAACAFGWFQALVYYPTLLVVVSWVLGVYVAMLFHWEATLLFELLVGGGFLTLSFLLNTLSARAGGAFQTIATILKLLPLAALAAAGLWLGDPAPALEGGGTDLMGGFAWFSAIGPVAFSYDGWIVSTSIAHEVKNARRNLPLALVVAPLLVLAAYLLYFLGVSCYLGPERVIALGDGHLTQMAGQLFGPLGAKLILVFVILSVMGTINGLTLGYIRLPYSLALRGMLPFSEKLRRIGSPSGVPVASALTAYGVCLIWSAIHFFTERLELLPNSDMSEVSIAVNYLLFALLYLQVFRLYRRGIIRGFVKGAVVPALALTGAAFTIAGALQSRYFVLYVLFGIGILLLSVLYYNTHILQKNGSPAA